MKVYCAFARVQPAYQTSREIGYSWLSNSPWITQGILDPKRSCTPIAVCYKMKARRCALQRKLRHRQPVPGTNGKKKVLEALVIMRVSPAISRRIRTSQLENVTVHSITSGLEPYQSIPLLTSAMA